MSDVWRRVFGTTFRTAFYLYGGLFWMKRHFSWKKECFYQYGLRTENSLTAADLFSALLTKLHFLSPEHYFEHLFEQFKFFSSIARFWIRISTLLAQMFGRSCRKCNLRVQTIIWWEFDSSLKNVTVLT